MVAAASYKPLYEAVTRSTLIKTIEPVVVFAGQPPNQYQQQVPGFASQFNAVNTMVCKYYQAIRSCYRPLTLSQTPTPVPSFSSLSSLRCATPWTSGRVSSAPRPSSASSTSCSVSSSTPSGASTRQTTSSTSSGLTRCKQPVISLPC